MEELTEARATISITVPQTGDYLLQAFVPPEGLGDAFSPAARRFGKLGDPMRLHVSATPAPAEHAEKLLRQASRLIASDDQKAATLLEQAAAAAAERADIWMQYGFGLRRLQ